MRLSELSTGKALDVLCKLTPYISNIVSDQELVNIVGEAIDTGENLNTYGKFLILSERIGKIAPFLLKAHRDDVYGILATVNEKSIAEIDAQSVLLTISQIREVFQDEELFRFFKSSVQQEQTK